MILVDVTKRLNSLEEGVRVCFQSHPQQNTVVDGRFPSDSVVAALHFVFFHGFVDNRSFQRCGTMRLPGLPDMIHGFDSKMLRQ